jgi:hypothetical protein
MTRAVPLFYKNRINPKESMWGRRIKVKRRKAAVGGREGSEESEQKQQSSASSNSYRKGYKIENEEARHLRAWESIAVQKKKKSPKRDAATKKDFVEQQKKRLAVPLSFP